MKPIIFSSSTFKEISDFLLFRFAIERQKRHSKQASFDLEEDELTHNGMAIDQLDTFDDVYNSDNYDGE